MSKRILLAFVLLVSVLYAISVSSYNRIDITKIEINGIDVTNIGNDTFAINKDSDMEIKVNIYANENVRGVFVEAFVKDTNLRLSDITNVFDVEVGTYYTKKLILYIPMELKEGDYQLIILVGNRDGRITTKSINLIVISEDRDNDGVIDTEDICPGTVLPENIPTIRLLRGHYSDIDGDGIFETLKRVKIIDRIVDSEYTLKDTSGCSCKQILDIKSGKKEGEYKFGCTQGTIEWFKKLNNI